MELVVISFCVIIETLGFKETAEKEGTGSEQQCSLRDDTMKKMFQGELWGKRGVKKSVLVQQCKKLQKWWKIYWDLATSLKFSYNVVNTDCC